MSDPDLECAACRDWQAIEGALEAMPGLLPLCTNDDHQASTREGTSA